MILFMGNVLLSPRLSWLRALVIYVGTAFAGLGRAQVATPPGSSPALVSGMGGTSGVVLVEVFEVL